MTGRESNLLLIQNVKVSYNTWLSKLGSLNCLVIGDNDIIGLSQVTSRTEKITAA